MTTKKSSTGRKSRAVSSDIQKEYDFSNARPNRFAKQFARKDGGGILVLLEPDVAEVFDSSRKVNKFLHATLPAVKK
jgi:hypothetical protein